MTSENRDPFDQLVDACKDVLAGIEERITKAGEAITNATEIRTKRLGQRDRIIAALGVLTSEKAPKKAGATGKHGGNHVVWTEEMRQAARQRMLDRQAAKVAAREAAEQQAPLGEPAPAAREP